MECTQQNSLDFNTEVNALSKTQQALRLSPDVWRQTHEKAIKGRSEIWKKTQQDRYICLKKLVKEMRINCHSSLYIHLATYTPSGQKLMSWGSSSMEFQKVWVSEIIFCGKVHLFSSGAIFQFNVPIFIFFWKALAFLVSFHESFFCFMNVYQPHFLTFLYLFNPFCTSFHFHCSHQGHQIPQSCQIQGLVSSSSDLTL